MRLKILFILIVACFALAANFTVSHASVQKSFEFKNGIFTLPLSIRDNSGVGRVKWPVTSGVPLPYGIVHKTDELSLINSEGKQIPCQFKALSRYYARDKSIRWVLIDFQIDLKGNEEKLVFLTNKSHPFNLENPIQIDENNKRLIVTTGKLCVTISKTRGGSLFDSVTVNDQEIINNKEYSGPFIRSGNIDYMEHFKGDSWNTHGWVHKKNLEEIFIKEEKYSGSRNIYDDVLVEDEGPLHAVVLLKGKFLSQKTGAGILKSGFYNYTTRLHFYMNKSFIKVEHSIDNSEIEMPFSNRMFIEAGLQHTLSLNGNIFVTAGGYKKDGDFELSTKEYGGESLLFQNLGVNVKKKGRKFAEPGKYVFSGVNSRHKEAEIFNEGRKAVFLDFSNEKGGLGIGIKYFWQEAPKAIEIKDNKLRVLLHANPSKYILSAESKAYDLDFGERSISDVLYYFHDEKKDKYKIRDIFRAFNFPLFAYAHSNWVAATETWYFEISPDKILPDKSLRELKHFKPSMIGYRLYGKNHGYNSGGHHESLNSGWLSFMRSGDLVDFEKNIAKSRWTIAHNPGWAFKNNIPEWNSNTKSLKEIDNFFKNWDRISGFGPKNFYLWRDTEKKGGGKTYLNMYKWLPDMEHYALFRLFEYYYLTGDRRALDSIYGFVNWAVNFQHKHIFKRKTRGLDSVDYFEKDPDALRRGHYSRVYTWMLYTTLAGYQATGNETYNQYAIWQIRRMLGLLRHRHGQLTSWNPKPSKVLGIFSKELQNKISQNVDIDLLRENQEVIKSKAKTWMEAQGVMTLHEAFKAYGDERILDGIWGMADYFSHHVLFFPRLGMINKSTSMPNRWFDNIDKIVPQRHDRHIQMWPILFHYTGWPSVKRRYDIFEEKRKNSYQKDWFLQTGYWQKKIVPKKTDFPPEAVTDLKLIIADRSGITLSWTSPKDDSDKGTAQRYFLKYSKKPIVEFAPTDHPGRVSEKRRIVKQVEDSVLLSLNGKRLKQNYYKPSSKIFKPELLKTTLWDPDWNEIDSFWMAEHVFGEPIPSRAGTKEVFTVKTLSPHNYFGIKKHMDIKSLKPGIYYFALCSWDEDKNLSKLSNVVKVKLE
ncbi:hypothetical protein [Desulfospira joergensenii]|uniref:exo-rhamnogalacturonan lyase family protein n=1 Tax=Desulfospira joergensenii TaxID=53329 RepID=UPI0003B3447A|nr:hypothetical protein [Desulfospira joergensenii]